MTNSELLNELVTKMAEQKGYAYTTGYLQSLTMQLISQLSKKEQSITHSDLLWHLKTLDSNCNSAV